MPLEEEMRNEMYKLEKEIQEIDEEMQKTSTKMINLINIRKKKEHNLRVLRENFGVVQTENTEVQATLDRILERTT